VASVRLILTVAALDREQFCGYSINMTTTNATNAVPKMTELLAIASEHGYPNWNPTTHPYRVMATVRSSIAHRGEAQVTGVFATEAEARTAFSATGPRAMIRVQIDLAVNADRWIESGRWSRIASRRAGSR
jgi:hypothetical protein